MKVIKMEETRWENVEQEKHWSQKLKIDKNVIKKTCPIRKLSKENLRESTQFIACKTNTELTVWFWIDFCLGGCERHETGVATSLLGVYLKCAEVSFSGTHVDVNRSEGLNKVYYGGFKKHV